MRRTGGIAVKRPDDTMYFKSAADAEIRGRGMPIGMFGGSGDMARIV
jgi:hypothetical protein